jgi:hypothetical protein
MAKIDDDVADRVRTRPGIVMETPLYIFPEPRLHGDMHSPDGVAVSLFFIPANVQFAAYSSKESTRNTLWTSQGSG